MPHETGNVNASQEARINVTLAGGVGIKCLVDTGFTGALMLPRAFVTKHALPIVGSETFRMVDDHIISSF
jgi:predicted aspartyl protease